MATGGFRRGITLLKSARSTNQHHGIALDQDIGLFLTLPTECGGSEKYFVRSFWTMMVAGMYLQRQPYTGMFLVNLD